MPSLVEIGPVILERIYNFFFNVLISLGEALALQVNKIVSPSPLCRLCELGPVVLKKKWKFRKVFKNKDKNNDDHVQRTNFDLTSLHKCT